MGRAVPAGRGVTGQNPCLSTSLTISFLPERSNVQLRTKGIDAVIDRIIKDQLAMWGTGDTLAGRY